MLLSTHSNIISQASLLIQVVGLLSTMQSLLLDMELKMELNTIWLETHGEPIGVIMDMLR
jgi:hypothetical protein